MIVCLIIAYVYRPMNGSEIRSEAFLTYMDLPKVNPIRNSTRLENSDNKMDHI